MRESRNLEFKESPTDSFLKTVSAFANFGGGTIIFGVRDDGVEVGVEDPADVALRIENKINDSIDPRPSFSIDVNDGNRTVSVEIEPGSHKPYLYRSKAYRRSDSATVEVDRLELGRLILEGQNLTFEELKARRQDLTFDVLERRLIAKLGIEKITRDTLKTLELYSDDQGFNIAGELLADENGFPGIDVAVFGNSISIIKERETFEHASLLKQYDQAIRMFRTHYVYEIIDGFTRKEVQTIPDSAFREAIANALVHRQWDSTPHVRVSMHPDRIEVVSPGGLPPKISEEEYLSDRVSVLRNPIIGNVFYRLGIIERFGTGIARIREAYENSVTAPSFKVYENSISVTLPLFREKLNLSSDESAVVDALDNVVLRSSGDVAARTGFGKTKVVRLLKDMAEKGIVEISGSGRSTKYKRPQ